MHAIRGILLSLLAGLALSAAASGAPEANPLLVVDVTEATQSERVLAASLQGLANRSPQGPRVFLVGAPRDAEWLAWSLRITPRQTEEVTPAQLLEALRPELRGQVLYDPAAPYTLDIATTVAGLEDAVASPSDLGLPTLMDLRGRWTSAAAAYRWGTENLLPRCSGSQAALLPPGSVAMRDFAIQRRMFAFSPPPSPEDPVFGEILLRLTPGAAIYGAAPATLMGALSEHSHFLVSSAETPNLSYLSRSAEQEARYQYRGYLYPAAPRYLSLIFDCSDLDLALDRMVSLWDDPVRGVLPLGWAVPGALAETAPAALRRYYADAYRSGMDHFVLGANGAGHMDLSSSPSPSVFYDATAQARAALDARTSLYIAGPASGASQLAASLAEFGGATGARGLFVVAGNDFEPSVYGGIAMIMAPRCNGVQDAVAYLDSIPLARRFAALCLNPRTMTPGDAARIAAHVADRYVVLPPEDLVELMRDMSLPQRDGPSSVAVSSVQYPDTPAAEDPLKVRALIEPDSSVLAASVMYQRVGAPIAFSEPLLQVEGAYEAQIPPVRCGGDLALRIRAVGSDGGVAWSPMWTVTIPRQDRDEDGLSDVEEHFLLTDPGSPDSDGDGLPDLNDRFPLRFDRQPVIYTGPVAPPSDLPYLLDRDQSKATAEGRLVMPGQQCVYRLPLDRLAPRADAIVSLQAEGPASVAVSADPGAFADSFVGSINGVWYSEPIPERAREGGIFVRVACPAAAVDPLRIDSIAVISPPEAPSVVGTWISPAHPGPGQEVTVSSLVYDPSGVSEVMLSYSVNGQGDISLPMPRVDGTQNYRLRLPAFDNRDLVAWWISARDTDGNKAATAPGYLLIGSQSRETVTLTAARDFIGEWGAARDSDNQWLAAPVPGLRDTARTGLTGGTYTLWLLGGGRGNSIAVYVGDKQIGSIDPKAPDGWQRVGRLRVDAGSHRVHLVSEARPDAPEGSSPRYAGVVLTANQSFTPPACGYLDIYNMLAVLSPAAGETLTGTVELKATGAGNVTRAAFYLGDQLIRQVSGPPFTLSLRTSRLPNGPHRLRVEALDRAGETGLAVEVPLTVAN